LSTHYEPGTMEALGYHGEESKRHRSCLYAVYYVQENLLNPKKFCSLIPATSQILRMPRIYSASLLGIYFTCSHLTHPIMLYFSLLGLHLWTKRKVFGYYMKAPGNLSDSFQMVKRAKSKF
jgi:hypothetical protein